MSKILDDRVKDEVAELMMEQLEDVGFTAEEAIPGMIQTVILLAEKTNAPEQALDEAANLLADSGKLP